MLEEKIKKNLKTQFLFLSGTILLHRRIRHTYNIISVALAVVVKRHCVIAIVWLKEVNKETIIYLQLFTVVIFFSFLHLSFSSVFLQWCAVNIFVMHMNAYCKTLQGSPGGGSSLIFVRRCAISGFETPPFDKARQHGKFDPFVRQIREKI